MPLLLTHPGTQYVYALAAQLQRQGILYRFATGLAFGEDRRHWLPGKLKRRVVAGVPDSRIHRQPLTELNALRHMRGGRMPEAVLLQRNLHFQQRMPQRLIEQASAVIGFDTSSWLLIDRSHQAGKPFILDVSIAHPLEKETIYAGLRRNYPEWHSELEAKNPALIKLEQQELDRADQIVVATAFTKSTLVKQGVDAAKISINPYGTDLRFFESKWDKISIAKPDIEKGITFAFLGIISARKGIPWLLKLWPILHSQYPNARLLLGGYGELPPGFRLPEGVELCGFVEPHQRTAFLHRADVFVFPSFFEGFAQVIIEAMACGLPVITTTPTVGPEVISNGQEGFVVNAGDDEALLQAMLFFAANPQQVWPMGQAARQRVQPYTWQAYGERWKQIAEGMGQAK